MSAVRICRHALLPPSRANFLCKTLKVATEMARCVRTYNLSRVLNIVGVEPLVCYLRNDLKAARTSSEKSFGSSQAAKWPPFRPR